MYENRLKFRKILPEDYQAIRNLLDEVEWPRFHFITDQVLFEKLLNNVDRSVVALEGSQVVGVASAQCDDVSIGYVTMFAILPHKQRCGIGDKLAKTLIGNDPHMKWVLSSAPKSVAFWEKQGFVFVPMMVKNREIDIFSQKHTDVTPKPTNHTFFRKQLSRIYRLNLYQCHQYFKRLIRKCIR